MESCPCGNARFDECCKPYLSGAASAPTAEALMRSRYSAYVKEQIDYLAQTLHPKERPTFDPAAAREWAKSAQWLGLEIMWAKGGPADEQGQVEFVARFNQNGADHAHHEVSRFRKVDGQWYFLDGRVIPAAGTVYQNDPCPCGSGKKFKRCCGKKER